MRKTSKAPLSSKLSAKSVAHFTVLGDAQSAGLYRLPQASAALKKSAAKHHLSVLDVQLAAVRDLPHLLDALGQALHFPEYYGGNLDALNDCLNDPSWQDQCTKTQSKNGLVIMLNGTKSLYETAATSLEQVLQILNEASTEWKAQGLALWVFVEQNTAIRTARPLAKID